MTGLAMRLEEERGWLVVVVAGRIDALSAVDFEEGLAEPLSRAPARLALDLAGVDYLSSPGLRVLLTSLKAVRRFEGEICLVAPRRHVRHVLAESGLEKIFAVCDTRESLPG